MAKINLIEFWKKKDKILDGITHSIFKRQDIEQLAQKRLAMCRSNTCQQYDPQGQSPNAVLKGAESCGACGCKLAWKTRALSDGCPLGFWLPVLTDVEESLLKEKLGITDENQ
jgi:hypothetical protein